MQGTFIGFNTAGITFEDRFLALLLKIILITSSILRKSGS